MVNGVNVSCACSKTPNGFSPFCHIGDGCLDVVLIRHTSLLNILRLLLRVSSKTRTMVSLFSVKFWKQLLFMLFTYYS